MGFCDKIPHPKREKPPKKETKPYKGKNFTLRFRYRGRKPMRLAVIDWVVDQPGKLFAPDPTTVFQTSTETEEMWDTVGGLQQWMNPCLKEHFRDSRNGYDNIAPLADGDGMIVEFGTTTPSIRPMIRDSFPSLNEGQLDELIVKTEEALSSVVDAEMSLANFLLELWQAAQGNLEILKKFHKLYEKALKLYHMELRRLLKLGVKEVSARWLAWNFAIKPTISDLCALATSFDAAAKKMKWLREKNHTTFTMYYHRDDLADTVDWDKEWYSPPGNGICTLHHANPPTLNGTYVYQLRITDYVLEYTASARVKLDIPEWFLDGFTWNKTYGRDYLWSVMQGLNNPVGIIWEAVSFSWLFDYFLSFRSRRFQRKWNYNPYNNAVTILESGHSWTLKITGDSRVINSTTGALHEQFGPWWYDLYERIKGLPTTVEKTFTRVPETGYKASILGALAVGYLLTGRRRNKKRRTPWRRRPTTH